MTDPDHEEIIGRRDAVRRSYDAVAEKYADGFRGELAGKPRHGATQYHLDKEISNFLPHFHRETRPGSVDSQIIRLFSFSSCLTFATLCAVGADTVSGTRMTDLVGIGVLTRLVHRDLVDEVLAETGKVEQRSRSLPARVVVYYVLALCLFFGESYEEVMRLLVEGCNSRGPGGKTGRSPRQARSVRRGSALAPSRCALCLIGLPCRALSRARREPGCDRGV
jgi:Insertion element 4 transposase N-terminal